MLEIAQNSGHQFWEKVWWPGLSADTESFIKSCYACQVTTPSTVLCEPLKTSEIPKMHWHTLALDIKGPFPCGINLLILIDSHSQYPMVTSVVNNKQCQHDLIFRKTFFRKITIWLSGKNHDWKHTRNYVQWV